MERQLATIQRIKSLEPILLKETLEEASSIELAQVLGYSVIVKKGEFKESDLCVFFEIDSILPEASWSEFLRSKHFHIKTMKLGSMRYKNVDAPVISQGLALPLQIAFDEREKQFPGMMWAGDPFYVVGEGYDLTELLGVTKYEAPQPVSLSKGIKSNQFHPLVPKTDELRVQSYPYMLEKLQGLPYVITQKLDGSSITVIYDDKIHVYSRNMEVDDTSLFYQTAFKEGLIDAAINDPHYAIQGEMVGPGIQSNRLGLKQIQIFIYNVYDTKQCKYLDYDQFVRFCLEAQIKRVPVLAVGVNCVLIMEELELISKENAYANGHPQEGIVVRPYTEMYLPPFGRLSFKYVNPEFLLKIGE